MTDLDKRTSNENYFIYLYFLIINIRCGISLYCISNEINKLFIES